MSRRLAPLLALPLALGAGLAQGPARAAQDAGGSDVEARTTSAAPAEPRALRITWRRGTIPPPGTGRGQRVLDASTSGVARGELVFCSYGIDDADTGRDDFAGKRLEGALALIVAGAPPGAAAADAPALRTFTKVLNARRRGAVGVVLMPEDADATDSSSTGRFPGSPGIPCLLVDWELALDLFGVFDLSFELVTGELRLDEPDPRPIAGDGHWEGTDVEIDTRRHREWWDADALLALLAAVAEPPRARLGFVAQPAAGRAGVEVVELRPGGAAERAGVATGDVLVRLGHVRTDDLAALEHAAHVHRRGDAVRIVVERGGERLELALELGR